MPICRIRLALAAALAILAPCGAGLAAPVEAYGRLPSLEDVAISPGGDRLAFVTTLGEQRTVVIQDLDKKAKPVLLHASQTKLRAIAWADDTRLMITTSDTFDAPMGLTAPRQEYMQAVVYDVVRKKWTRLEPNTPDALLSVLRPPVARQVGGKTRVFFQAFEFPAGAHAVRSLFSFDPDSQMTERVAQGVEDLETYLVGPAGGAAAESVYRGDRWYVRVRQNGGWATSVALETHVDVPEMVGFGATPDTAVVLAPTAEGGAYDWRELSLKDASWRPASPAILGAQSLITDPVTGAVIGAVRDGDHKQYAFLDPAFDQRWRAILKAFPGEQIDFVSMSADRTKVVVSVFGQDTGAAYMWVDLVTGHADLIGDLYDGVPPEQVAPVRPITYPAGDGLPIPAYLTLPKGRPAKALPLIVLAHGGPAARDELHFDWWAQAMAAQGYAVLQPEFRGSDGFSGDFLRAGFGQWGRKMQSDLSDGVRFLAAQGVIDPKRVCLVGASYGGYAALAGVTVQTGLYRCAVAVAGPADLKAMLAWERARYQIARKTVLPYWERFMGATGEDDPALDAISPAKLAAKVDAPLLLIHGRNDTVVAFEQSEIMARALKAAGKPVAFVSLAGEDHWLSRSETRLQMLQALVAFIEKNNPPDPPAQAAAAR